MRQSLANRRLPKISVTETDFESLTLLANQALDRVPAVAEDLLSELDRAKIVPEKALKSDTVRMGSTLTFRRDEEAERTITLVYPAEADISAGRVSILTPVGTALLGLKEGQSILWKARDGKTHVLAVTAVAAPGHVGAGQALADA